MKVITDDLDIAILQKIRQERARQQQDQMVQLELELPVYDYPVKSVKEEEEYKNTVIIIEI